MRHIIFKLKLTLAILILWSFSAFTVANESRISEAELVSIINENGYSVISSDTQSVKIEYLEVSDSWKVTIQALCNKENCICIDCETIIGVSGTKESPNISIALDG